MAGTKLVRARRSKVSRSQSDRWLPSRRHNKCGSWFARQQRERKNQQGISALCYRSEYRRTRHIRHCRRLERWYYGHSLDGHGDRVRLPVSAEHNTRRYNELAASSAPPWRFQRNWPDTAAGPSHTRGAATHQRLRGPSGYGRMAKLEPSSRPATYIHLRSGRWKSGHYARIRFP